MLNCIHRYNSLEFESPFLEFRRKDHSNVSIHFRYHCNYQFGKLDKIYLIGSAAVTDKATMVSGPALIPMATAEIMCGTSSRTAGADAGTVEQAINLLYLDESCTVSVAKTFLLVADDSYICQKMIRKELTRAGFEADGAMNGQDCVDMIRASPDKYSAILMDIRMPLLNGINATRILRQELQFHFPIIALSAETCSTITNEILLAGANAILQKPARITDIVAVLENFGIGCD